MANHDEASSPPQIVVPDDNDGEDLVRDHESGHEADDTPLKLETVAKKTKKRKPKSKRGIAAPTGFEEYYVDPPITPDEYTVEQELYSSNRGFSQRIETAIQRYKARRNLDSERKDLFDKYMVYGGVDTGPKMFGGLDQRTLEGSSAAEITALTATIWVGENREESDGFVVDFDGCAKGFLSSRLHQVFELTTQKQICSHVSVIRNFLNYLLHHDVCPEFADQINAARKTCDLAEKELWLVAQLGKTLPGDFNVACSTLFGGYYENVYVGETEWYRTLGLSSDAGMSTDRARRVFKFGIAARLSGDLVDEYNKQVTTQTLKVTESFETGLEVLDLLPPEQDVLELYAKFPSFYPLGRVRVRTWYPPWPPQEDLTTEEEDSIPSKEYKEYILWVEDYILSKAFKGMKFEATIRKLSFGVLYFDSITTLYCSFYDILPNELMLGWREHVYLEPRDNQSTSQNQNAIAKEGNDEMVVEDEGEVEDDEKKAIPT